MHSKWDVNLMRNRLSVYLSKNIFSLICIVGLLCQQGLHQIFSDLSELSSVICCLQIENHTFDSCICCLGRNLSSIRDRNLAFRQAFNDHFCNSLFRSRVHQYASCWNRMCQNDWPCQLLMSLMSNSPLWHTSAGHGYSRLLSVGFKLRSWQDVWMPRISLSQALFLPLRMCPQHGRQVLNPQTTEESRSCHRAGSTLWFCVYDRPSFFKLFRSA